MKSLKTISIVGIPVLLIACVAGLVIARRRPHTPAPVTAYTDTGFQLAKSGHTTEAVVEFNRAIALSPTRPEPYIGLAVLYESANRPDLAIETLEQLQAANPQAEHLGCRLAEAHLGAEDLKGARELGEKAVAREPNCARAHSVYGLTMLRFRYWVSAADELKRAIQLAPEDKEIPLVLLDVYIQHALYDQAVELGEQLAAKSPGSARLQYKLGWAYGRLAGRSDGSAQSIAHLQKAIKLDPRWFEPYAELGRVYNSLGESAKALAAFEKAWSLNSSIAGVAYNLTTLYRQRHDKRADLMDTAFHRLMKQKEDFTALRRDYNSASDSPSAVLSLAAAEGKAGLYGEALYRLRKLLRTDPSNLDALKLYIRLDQEVRAQYPDYLRPGPGIGFPGS
jgi:tetratricopeptide (TPR) repeat protein